MSTFLYYKAKSDFASGALSWPASNAKAMLLDAGYVPSFSHQYVSDITSAASSAIASRDIVMTGLAQTNGLCTGLVNQVNAFVWPRAVVAIVIYASTGVDATSRLIYYSSDGFGFPFTAVGFNYGISYDQSFTGWFQV